MKRKNNLLIITLLFASLSSFAQWECPSKMPAHLTPFHEKVPLNWALEISPAFGKMSDRTIQNGMIFGGLQYLQNNHEVYVEGGIKMWKNKNDQYSASDQRWGLREAYYSFNNGTHAAKVGFQSMNSGDYVLLNERAYGLAYNYSVGVFDLDIDVASVTKDFSRAGIFCTKSYIYNLVADRTAIPIGSVLGETNFSSASLSMNPSEFFAERKTKTVKDEESGDDEFEEFESFDEFEDVEEDGKTPFIQITNLGAIFYNEFGTLNNEFGWWAGAFAEATLPLEFKLHGEILLQETVWSDGYIGYIGIDKVHFWPKRNRTILSAGYYTFLSENENNNAAMSFSNLWYGEVIRLDGVDMPFWQVSAKHNFPKIKTHLKLQYVKQLHDQQMSEVDFAIGKTWFKHLKTTAMFGRMTALELEKIYYMARLEVRITI